jgi:DNA-binding PucR family transcriptional regulator
MTETAIVRGLIATLATELLGERDAVTAGLVERVHADPAVPDDRDLRDATWEAGARIVEQLLAQLRDGRPMTEIEPPAAAIDYAHEFVHRGIELPTLLAVVRTGYAEFSRRWSSRLSAEAAPSQDSIEALSASLLEIFAYVDAISTAFAIAYSAERERWSRSIEALRLDVVRAILDEHPIDPEVAGQRLGQRLDGRHIAFVVWSDADPALGLRSALEGAVAELYARAEVPGTLVVPLGGQVLAGWLTGVGAAVDLDRLATDPLHADVTFDVRAALGTPGDGIGGFRASHRQALHARRVARGLEGGANHVTTYASVALAALASSDLDHAREFVRDELRALAADDQATRRIAGTLLVYLEEGRSRARTARRLGLHTNTIAYRLARAADLLGHELDHRSAEVQVALTLAPLLPAVAGTGVRDAWAGASPAGVGGTVSASGV